jgi:hypothetical protein
MDTASITMIWKIGAECPGLFVWDYLDVLRLNQTKMIIDLWDILWYNKEKIWRFPQ